MTLRENCTGLTMLPPLEAVEHIVKDVPYKIRVNVRIDMKLSFQCTIPNLVRILTRNNTIKFSISMAAASTNIMICESISNP